MKGFKKDGKFRPTEKKPKSALKKSDMKKVSKGSGVGHEMREKKSFNRWTQMEAMEKDLIQQREAVRDVIADIESDLDKDKGNELFYEKIDVEILSDIEDNLDESISKLQVIIGDEDYSNNSLIEDAFARGEERSIENSVNLMNEDEDDEE